MSGNKYPARAHALKAVGELAKLIPEQDREKVCSRHHLKCLSLARAHTSQTHGIFVQSAPNLNRFDTDRELPYRECWM